VPAHPRIERRVFKSDQRPTRWRRSKEKRLMTQIIPRHSVDLGQGVPDKSGPISSVDLDSFQSAFEAEPQNRLMQNAVTKVGIGDIALDRSLVTKMDHTFSNTLDSWAATHQKRSGRCWIFAGLNVMRTNAMNELANEDFELSQNYSMFWDKLEKANYFLESIIDTADQPADDRTVHYLLRNPVADGGQWNMFAALITKYGVIPKSVMPETYSSSNTHGMNGILTRKLREYAKELRDLHQIGTSAEELRARKDKAMVTIYRILSIHLGTPPKSFLWQWKKKDGSFQRDGVLTPKEFAKKYVKLPFEDYVCLVHDPRESSPRGRTFTVQYLGNVVGGVDVKYLNIDIEQMKTTTMQTILAGEPVWFGCDTGKMMEKTDGLWDKNLFDYAGVYRTEFKLSKADRLVYGESAMTHAMVFTGVDVVDGKPRRWRVENSWGTDVGRKGFFLMNDSWFDEYVFEIAARKSTLPAALQTAYDQKPIVLPAWDPMGSLAK
jgi:bleomycin hydrolase